jgi:hypothetical protein
LDPVIPPATHAQLVDHARRIDAYKAALAQNGISPNGDPGNYGGSQGSAYVVAYAEPNTDAYRYYCGPGASQVVISSWNINVPSIDALASQEHTNPTPPTRVLR